MLKVQTILLLSLLVGFGLTADDATKVVDFTCEKVASSVCSSLYRYRVSGSYEARSIDYTYCLPSGKTCTPKTSKFNLQSCKVDYKFDTCSTGVCFMFPSHEICQTNTQCGTAESPKTFNINYKCDACTNTTDCAKCFFETSNESGADVEVQTCLGATCTEGIGTATTTIGRCAGGKDFLGQQCDCCITTVEVSRFCTTNS